MGARSGILFRYLVSQLLTRTLVMMLVLTGMFWLIQMLRLFGIVTDKAQGFGVLLVLSGLLLPQIIQTLLFVALTLSSAQMLIKMNKSNELHALHGADFYGTLFRAILAVSIGLTLLAGTLILYVTPHALNMQRPIFRQISADILGRSLSVGGFVEIAKNVTISVEIDADNPNKRTFFLHDSRDKAQETTYFSTDARLDEFDGKQAIILLNGSSQNFNKNLGTIGTSNFAQFRIDLIELTERDVSRSRRLNETFTGEIIEKISSSRGTRLADAEISELALRLSEPLYVFIAPLLAFALLGYPAQSRTRKFPMELAIFVIIVFTRGLGIAATNVAAHDASKVYFDFVAPVLILGLIVFLLVWRRFRRQGFKPVPSAHLQQGVRGQ